jgi:hypothetical protein
MPYETFIEEPPARYLDIPLNVVQYIEPMDRNVAVDIFKRYRMTMIVLIEMNGLDAAIAWRKKHASEGHKLMDLFLK